MTTKEKLYKQYIEIKNEYYTLNNEPEKVIELTDEYLNGWKFKSKATEFKVDEWHDNIDNAKSGLEHLKKELRKLAYYATEEGKAYEANIMAKHKELLKKTREMENEVRSHISDIITNFLGSGWEVGHVGDCQTEISYVKGYDENGKPLLKRSYYFSIYYRFGRGENNAFQMNYPTCGSWDLFNDENMRVYLNGVGKFGTNDKFLRDLFNILKKYVTEHEELRIEDYKVMDKLHNPDVLKDIEED